MQGRVILERHHKSARLTVFHRRHRLPTGAASRRTSSGHGGSLLCLPLPYEPPGASGAALVEGGAGSATEALAWLLEAPWRPQGHQQRSHWAFTTRRPASQAAAARDAPSGWFVCITGPAAGWVLILSEETHRGIHRRQDPLLGALFGCLKPPSSSFRSFSGQPPSDQQQSGTGRNREQGLPSPRAVGVGAPPAFEGHTPIYKFE